MILSNYWPTLYLVFGAALIAFLSPGPNFVAIVSTAVNSRLNGCFVAIGISVGTTFWAAMAVTGVSALLSRYPQALLFLQILGGGYLIWLGIKSLRSSMKKRVSPILGSYEQETPIRSFNKGFLVQLTNPKTAIFWVSVVSVAILPNTPALVGVILILGTTLIAFTWHFILAFAFSLDRVRDKYLRMQYYISILFGIVFIALGSRLLLWNVAF